MNVVDNSKKAQQCDKEYAAMFVCFHSIIMQKKNNYFTSCYL